MGISWEFRGNFVGKTFFFVGISWNFYVWLSKSYNFIWELRGNNFFFRGNNLGITWEKLGKNLGKSQRFEMEKLTLTILQKKIKKKTSFLLSNQKTFLYLYQ